VQSIVSFLGFKLTVDFVEFTVSSESLLTTVAGWRGRRVAVGASISYIDNFFFFKCFLVIFCLYIVVMGQGFAEIVFSGKK
jgi:hypothetical protein